MRRESVLRGPAIDRHTAGLLGLIADVTHASPAAIACIDDRVCLTYAELGDLSDTLAAQLAADVERTPVALCLPRGPELTLAMLGCLKSGRPFLPLDVCEAPARLESMAAQARPGLVAGSPAAQLPPALSRLPFLEVDTLAARARAVPATPPRAVAADDPAYIIFTSGTTGEPKGVQVCRRALCNRLRWGQDTFALACGDIVLHKTPVTFDVAVWELLGPLLGGATIAFLAPGAHQDPGEVLDAIVRHQVSTCHFVPAMLTELLRWPGAGACSSLRDVFCGGEPLRPELAQAFGAAMPARLHNMYGPAEAAIDVTHWAVPDPASCQRVFAGSPVSNTDLYVVDEDLNVVPEGEPGELCIAGAQVADGYVGRPEETAAAFVRLPGGPRVYRTGDRARITRGLLEIVGRLDDQVKIRGVRVEPREVEQVIGAHPHVGEVAVVAGNTGWGKELFAFVTCPPDRERATLTADIMAHARARLSGPFVPAAIHVLERMPVTNNGKQDRRRLAAWAANREPAALAAPGDELAALWHEVCMPGPDSAGFTDLGGNSLGAARFARRLLRLRGHRIPLRWLLTENLSLAGLRQRLAEQAEDAAAAAGASPSLPLPLTPGQRRLWFLGQLHGSLSAYNVVSALRFPTDLPPELLLPRLREAMRRHGALRTRIVVQADGEPMQELAPDAEPPLRVLESASPAEHLALTETVMRDLRQEEFNSDHAPMFRVTVVRRADRAGTAIVIAGNHMVLDQYSVELLWSELLLQVPAAAPAWRLPDAASPDEQAEALRFWRAELDGAPGYLRLPFRRARPGRPSFAGHTMLRRLDPAAAEALRDHCAQQRVRLGALVLAAFAATLVSWSDDDEVVVGVPYDARRSRWDADRVGFCVDTLPVRLCPEPEQPLALVAAACQQRMSAAAAHHAAGFDDIVAKLGQPRTGTANPVFQVWFNDLTAIEQPVWFAGHLAERPRAAEVAALFDVGLYLYADPDGSLLLRLTVAAELFPPRVADLLADGVEHVLRRFVADPQATVAAALPGGPPQAGQVTVPAADLSDLLSRFATVGRPEDVAIWHGGTVLCYAELRERVRAVAGGLAKLATPGSVVGFLAERTPNLAVAVLASWSAGITPLIMDRRLPPPYRSHVVQQCAARTVLGLDDLPTDEVGPADLPPPADAHIIVTSGTTGGPKPVAVPAGTFATALLAYAAEFQVGRLDRLAFLAGPGHDPAFRDLILPLVLGASVAIPGTLSAADPLALAGSLAERGVTILHLTPAQADLLAAAARDVSLPGVRLAVLCGAALGWQTVSRLRALCPGADIVNAYGTTEIAQLSGVYHIGAHGAGPTVPIGTGLPPRALTVLRDGRPAATGQLGQIAVIEPCPPAHVIGGTLPTLRLGALTAVLTGDMGRRDLEGNVVWCGRCDRQLAVDGYRIEPHEIEEELRRDPRAAHAVVAMAGYPPALTAFVVPVAEIPPGWGTALDEMLRRRLPPWMVPAEVRVVQRLVTDRNGKVDTAAMAAAIPGPPGAPPASGHLDTTLERLLRAQLPSGAEVPRDLNFFDAGLDSYGMLRLLHELRRSGFAWLELIDLFTWPNLAALSRALREGREGTPRG